MPVNLLYVEGELDAQILSPIFGGAPVVRAARASKNALAPIVARERREGHKLACYLRDRDFDFDPPADSLEPVEDRREGVTILGWRWCRHEIENYMLDPAIAPRLAKLARPEYEEALVHAGRRIVHYQAARWTVGMARRVLPPFHELRTRPREADHREFFLPPDLTPAASQAWATEQVKAFRDRVLPSLDDRAAVSRFEDRSAILAGVLAKPAPQSAADMLVWFAGKDLLAALSPWLLSKGCGSPGAFRAVLRDGMMSDPAGVLTVFPEWQSLLRVMRS